MSNINIKKHQILFLVLLMLCLCLAACGNKTVGQHPSGTAPGTTGSAQPPTTGLTAEDIELPSDGWYNLDAGVTQTGAFGEGGYYREFRSMLVFTDLSNGNDVFLCSKPGCLHYDEPTIQKEAECDAYIGIMYCIHYQNGKIYYVASNLSSEDGSLWLMCRNADGTGEKKIGRLASEYITSDTSVRATQFVFAGDMLYYRADVEKLIQNESGTLAETGTRLLMRMELSSGKEEQLEEYLNEAPHLQGAREDMLLYYTIRVYTKEELEADPSLNQERPTKLKVWLESAEQSITLFTYKHTEYQGDGYIADGKYYYPLHKENDEGTVVEMIRCYVFDLATQQTEDTGLQSAPILNNRYAVYFDDNMRYQYLFDTATGNRLEMEYTNVRLTVLTNGPDGAIFKIAQYSENAEGGVDVISDLRYIPYAMFEDGLQKTDGIVIPIK